MKQMLFDLYNELEVTKSEALAIACMIDNGKLDLGQYVTYEGCGCWFGLASISKRFTDRMPQYFYNLSLSNKYEVLEGYEGPEASQWVREYAEQL